MLWFEFVEVVRPNICQKSLHNTALSTRVRQEQGDLFELRVAPPSKGHQNVRQMDGTTQI